MSSRTQLVCLHEGKKGRSIDPVFINCLIKALKPVWLRPMKGSNLMRPVDCGGRRELIERTPSELRACLNAGSDTTLIVWADVDDDMEDCDQLKEQFWRTAQAMGISEEEFSQIVFVFAKDRLENWIEFLTTGATDESIEGPRVKHNRQVADAAKALARRCLSQETGPRLPQSLEWSCGNWKELVTRMRDA